MSEGHRSLVAIIEELAKSGQKPVSPPDDEDVARIACCRCGHTMELVVTRYLGLPAGERGCIKGCEP
jgi:hypothetical protein